MKCLMSLFTKCSFSCACWSNYKMDFIMHVYFTIVAGFKDSSLCCLIHSINTVCRHLTSETAKETSDS